MKRTIVTLALLAITCVAAAFSASAFAYKIEAKGAEAKGGGVVFALGEAGKIVCKKILTKQPNKMEKELITEEQDLFTTFNECSGKLGGGAVKATVSPEVDFKISAGEKAEGSETKFKGITLTIVKEMVMKVGIEGLECTLKMPAEPNKHLKELKWENTNTKKGEYRSKFVINVAGEAFSSGVGCEFERIKAKNPWSLGEGGGGGEGEGKTPEPLEQDGEVM